MNRPLRAVAYIRVSQEREDMISPELQETAIRDHCRRNGYEVAEVLTDLDLSGRFWKRRQVERAVSMIESREVDVIVVWKMSRVARNRLDWNIALDRVETAGGRLESATEPIDVTTSSVRFSRGILAELAAFESERAGEQWGETHRRRWSRGLPHTGRARFGYTYENGEYTIDPETAPVVREMFARYNSGIGLLKISQWLNTLHLPLAPATDRGVQSFLSNGFAAGFITHHDPACQLPHAPGQKQCPNRIRERGSHEPIVDIETFDAYLIERARRLTVARRSIGPVSAFTGIVWCAGCGRKMAHTTGGNRSINPHFRCNNMNCPAQTSSAESKIERAVLAWLPTVADAVSEHARKRAIDRRMIRADRERLEKVAARAETALNKLTMDFARGMIPDGAYTVTRAALEAERDEAALAASALRSESATAAERGALAVDLLAVWDEMPVLAKNRVLRQLCIVEISQGSNYYPDISVHGLWEKHPLLRR